MPAVFYVLCVSAGLATASFGGYLLHQHQAGRGMSDASGEYNNVGVRLPAGLVVLILGLALAFGVPGAVFATTREPSKTATPTEVPTPAGKTGTATSPPLASAAPTTSGVSTIVVKAPLNGTEISGIEGVVISGTAQNLGDNTIWILDYGFDGTGSRVFYRDNTDPLSVVGGNWTFTDRPIGNGSRDIGQVFKISIVEASPACARVLKSATPGQDGSVIIPVLPGGCTQVDQREVKKTRM
ncbi:hypothetical protein I6A60_37915 [Frankia sp. AgB1.9]|nr:hypothetical protein [Frankia sp. AgB1.9]